MFSNSSLTILPRVSVIQLQLLSSLKHRIRNTTFVFLPWLYSHASFYPQLHTRVHAVQRAKLKGTFEWERVGKPVLFD